jgi:hypothetical protein
LFVTVTLEAALFTPITWFPNVRLAGDAVTAATPVPLRLTVCGLFVPVSFTVSVPVREPRAVGVSVTEIVHVFPAASVEGLTGHVLV